MCVIGEQWKAVFAYLGVLESLGFRAGAWGAPRPRSVGRRACPHYNLVSER